jgi:hypothetical protein
MTLKLNPYRRESRLRVLFPPAVLVTFLWAGLQVLLLIYLRVVLLYPTAPGAEVFSASSAAAPALGLGLLVVNLLFVGLIWLNYRPSRLGSQPAKLAAMLTFGGTTLLLLFLQWKWLEILRLAF